jgi:hypothetical protein
MTSSGKKDDDEKHSERNSVGKQQQNQTFPQRYFGVPWDEYF